MQFRSHVPSPASWISWRQVDWQFIYSFTIRLKHQSYFVVKIHKPRNQLFTHSPSTWRWFFMIQFNVEFMSHFFLFFLIFHFVFFFDFLVWFFFDVFLMFIFSSNISRYGIVTVHNSWRQQKLKHELYTRHIILGFSTESCHQLICNVWMLSRIT